MKINEARQLLRRGELSTTDKPQYQGRSGRFWPVLRAKTPLSINNITAKLDFPSLESSTFSLDQGESLGEGQRLGLILQGWLKNIRGKSQAIELIHFLGKPDENGIITLKLNVGQYLDNDEYNGVGKS